MIRRLVLDVLKPHEPPMVTFSSQLSQLESVSGVTTKLVEMEEDVRTVRVAIEGEDLDLSKIEASIEDLSGSIHSVDEVSCGDRIVDDPWLNRG
ncbi:hypothetical protein AArcSl_0517 [Halalkaliarchaeum desulfuricum]|uniref:DUF211 domain-containing protein n=1 Tax=Halalkaliarchaeum desulfuricum TaxID=2055893 RepID=A0A343TGE6_9EURY|nr:DUF211 domain-containing protein [Halalkaliarchaeum desulfuricum]AUX08168.1 hypothetical protein AArcSl_0517 [Halalkaliarchaeum desulfuricum]